MTDIATFITMSIKQQKDMDHSYRQGDSFSRDHLFQSSVALKKLHHQIMSKTSLMVSPGALLIVSFHCLQILFWIL